MINRVVIVEKFLSYLGILLFSLALSNVDLFNNYFVFIVPWIFFCFLNNKWYGAIAISSAFLFLGIINKWFLLSCLIILFSILFIKNILRLSNKKMKIILSWYNFVVVFLCGLLNNVIVGDNLYLISFVMGVVSYWLMYYFCELCFAFNGIEDNKLDSRLSSFILIIIGIAFLGLKISVWNVDIWYVAVLFLSFVGIKIGFEVGIVYSLVMIGLMLLDNVFVVDLFLFGGASLLFFFLSKVSKMTLVFTYVACVFLVVYYLKLDYFIVVDYSFSALVILLMPNRFIRNISSVCYGSDLYIKKLCSENKKFNLEISNKIIKMEEVFSLVCEKVDIKERIRKNDKRLLVEEVNLFDNLLKNFSKEIKENYNFDVNYKAEREFYKRGVDLLNFKIRENVFKNRIIDIDVRCEEKEIQSLVIPLVSRIVNNKVAVSRINYNEVFGYYSLVVESKKRVGFKYGISQKSLDGMVCGDSYLVYENDSKYIFAISDGMGTGKMAREASKLALDLFKKFMDIGFGVKQALRSLNSILMEKYSKDNYSTLDLFICDKYEERYYFCKNGASDSYLLSNDNKIIKGNDLPLGIIDKSEYEFKEVCLKKGDCLVMTSDGVGDINLGEVEKIKNKDSQKISEFIIGNKQVINDDKTVFVIKVC